MSRGTPERCWRTARTSSRVSTTGKCTGPLGPDDLVEPGQVDAEHLAVEKEQGAQGLVLGGGGDLPLNSERGQECGDFRGAHFRRMTLAVEEYVALDPVDIGLLSASAVVAGLDGVADAVEEAGLRRLRRAALLGHRRDAATAVGWQRRMVA